MNENVENNNVKAGHEFKKPAREFKRTEREKKLYEDKIISLTKVTKVTKGGRNFRFSATVAVGDRKGKVGIGTGKSKEIPVAVSKAIKEAEKNIDSIGTRVPAIHFAPLSAILSVLSYLFQLFYPSGGKIRSIKGKLSGH